MKDPDRHPGARTSTTTLSQMTSAKFSDLPISALTKRALAEVLRYETMTVVQQQSLPVALTGADVLAKAKTGTGKTLSFLIPALESALRPPAMPGKIKILCVSPTRELASQILEEGLLLCKFHTGLKLMCVFGGTNMKKVSAAPLVVHEMCARVFDAGARARANTTRSLTPRTTFTRTHATHSPARMQDLSLFQQRPPDLLVATPGRLNDHLQNSGLDALMQNLRVLIFDEACPTSSLPSPPSFTLLSLSLSLSLSLASSSSTRHDPHRHPPPLGVGATLKV